MGYNSLRFAASLDVLPLLEAMGQSILSMSLLRERRSEARESVLDTVGRMTMLESNLYLISLITEPHLNAYQKCGWHTI